MRVNAEVTGLNLERLLTLAARAGIVVYDVQRVGLRALHIGIDRRQLGAFEAICQRAGWEMRITGRSFVLNALMKIKRRPMLLLGALLCVVLVWVSSRMIWRISIADAGKAMGEIRMLLEREGIHPGILKARVKLSELQEKLLLSLPDLAYAGAAFQGSTLVIDCRMAREGNAAGEPGAARDLIAAQDGIVTHLSVQSGTPRVCIGQAVKRGDVLIEGTERGEKQTVHAVIAQGQVTARVFARGDARVSRSAVRTVETGEYRRRITLCTPWSRRTVRDAQPFDHQDKSVFIEPVVGLYLPVWREIETFARIVSYREERSEADAASMAQAAAYQAAKKQCPAGVRILDKTVEYSMIDHEYVYATVVLEYEQNIAMRADGPERAGID